MTGTILFAGGPSGGHLYPGLALADELSTRFNVRPCFMTSGREIETRVLAESDFEQRAERALDGLSPRRPLGALRALRAVGALFDEVRPRGVIALGGAAALIPAFVAWRRRLPVFLLEQNAILGRAHRRALPLAERVFLSFDDTIGPLSLRRCALRTGCPVRREFSAAAFDPAARSVLVIGGSQGAASLNELVPEAMAAVHATVRASWTALHICGPGKSAGLDARYRELGFRAEVREYVDDVSRALRASGLVIARAGGSTVAEVSAVGRGTLLLPYPHHRDRQQYHNADALVRCGGARTIRDASTLAQELSRLLTDDDERAALARGARSIGRPAATRTIAEIVGTHLGLGEAATTTLREAG